MTQYVLRDYQAQAVERGLAFLLETKKLRNGLIYIPTGGGKALVAGSLAVELANTAPVVIFQPSKEILEQNMEKIESYGFRAAVLSASMGRREVGDVTLATIGTAYKHPEWFEDFQFGLADEAHLIGFKDNSNLVREFGDQFYHRDLGLVTPLQNQEGVRKGKVKVVDEDGTENEIPLPKKSMYKSFAEALPHMRWAGLTASPYRLESDAMGSQLKVITRTRQRLWHEFIHYTQYRDLFAAGYLAKLEYFQIRGFKPSTIPLNSTGAEYDYAALQLHLWERNWETKDKKAVHFPDKLTEVVSRVLDAGRRNVMVFTSSVRESEYLAERMKGECAVVTGETPPDERAATVRDFRSGEIKVLTNCGVYIHGFDFPGLETVIDAGPTKSLSRYDQKIGRGARISPAKQSTWIIDMVSGYEQFGRLEDRMLYCQGNSRWDIFGRPGGGEEKQLTSKYLGGEALKGCCPKCRAPKILAYYSAKGKWLPFSIPPAGRRGDIVIKLQDGKKVAERVEPGDGSHSFHFRWCKIFAEMRGQAA